MKTASTNSGKSYIDSNIQTTTQSLKVPMNIAAQRPALLGSIKINISNKQNWRLSSSTSTSEQGSPGKSFNKLIIIFNMKSPINSKLSIDKTKSSLSIIKSHQRHCQLRQLSFSASVDSKWPKTILHTVPYHWSREKRKTRSVEPVRRHKHRALIRAICEHYLNRKQVSFHSHVRCSHTSFVILDRECLSTLISDACIHQLQQNVETNEKEKNGKIRQTANMDNVYRREGRSKLKTAKLTAI